MTIVDTEHIIFVIIIRYMHPFFVGMRTYSALRCNDWMNFEESLIAEKLLDLRPQN